MRDASTYRGARRNAAIHDGNHEVWGPQHYFDGHDPQAGRPRGYDLRRRWHRRGQSLVKAVARPAGAAKPRPAIRAPAINKAAPRGQ